MREFFIYDHSGLVVRTTNKCVVMGVAKQILKGIAYLSWYATDNPGGSAFSYDDFAWTMAKSF